MIKDENKTPVILKNLAAFNGKTVEVGVFGEEMALVAHVNEYGANIKVTDRMRKYLHALGLHLKKETQSIKIPERSFVRSTFDDKKIIDSVFEITGKALEITGDPEKALNGLGAKMANFIQKKITSGIQPPNHPFTTDMKGGKNKTLVNTGRLTQAVRYKIS